jgi:hypothetical protein
MSGAQDPPRFHQAGIVIGRNPSAKGAAGECGLCGRKRSTVFASSVLECLVEKRLVERIAQGSADLGGRLNGILHSNPSGLVGIARQSMAYRFAG